MLLNEIDGFSFYSRSGGVVVLKGNEYVGFYDNLNEALVQIFGDC